MNYTNSLSEATHWKATFDSNWKCKETLSGVTLEKVYELKRGQEEELYVIDDKGDLSTIFLCHNGELVTIKNLYGSESGA
ncbi:MULTISPECIES: hypothetical protein [Brevibacillus]|uniref:hypothetical protein n=1 Tax=Brevibacillus TaxID=55080 RepID=UPI000E2FB9E7|nr:MULTISPECIES: hypothetical protein [Brevibacillus]MED1789072.1 hypothetical protein [Brevibacillus laterosporus]RFB34966.1 hypothetical protein DZB91_10580 [Brevibacillus sp. VP]